MRCCIPTVPAEGGCTRNILPVCQENLPCTRWSVLATAIQLLRDWEGVSVSGCRAGAQPQKGSWKLKVTFDATLGKKIQHLIWFSIGRPTNDSFFHWKYGFGQWWNPRPWKQADEKVAASSHWRRGSALLLFIDRAHSSTTSRLCSSKLGQSFCEHLAASHTVDKATSELEIEEPAELHQADSPPAEPLRLQEQVCSPTCCTCTPNSGSDESKREREKNDKCFTSYHYGYVVFK